MFSWRKKQLSDDQESLSDNYITITLSRDFLEHCAQRMNFPSSSLMLMAVALMTGIGIGIGTMGIVGMVILKSDLQPIEILESIFAEKEADNIE